jgi:hypothetical protein
MVVNLKTIIEALEMTMENLSQYLDTETGEIIIISDDDAFDLDDLEDQVSPEQIEKNPKRYLLLPDRYEIHEWRIMQEFANSIETAEISEQLLIALQGKVAFRYFKDTAARLGVLDRWYIFRTEQLTMIAKQWCDEQQIEYQEN